MDSKRMVIYTKDIQRITGKSERTARQIMSYIRTTLGKRRHQLVSVGEFCSFVGLSEDEVAKYID